MDSTPGAVYPKIVSLVNEEVFSLQVRKTRTVYFRHGTEWQQGHINTNLVWDLFCTFCTTTKENFLPGALKKPHTNSLTNLM